MFVGHMSFSSVKCLVNFSYWFVDSFVLFTPILWQLCILWIWSPSSWQGFSSSWRDLINYSFFIFCFYFNVVKFVFYNPLALRNVFLLADQKYIHLYFLLFNDLLLTFKSVIHVQLIFYIVWGKDLISCFSLYLMNYEYLLFRYWSLVIGNRYDMILK